MADKPLGKITHYFDHLGVAVISLSKGAKLSTGDQIQIKGHATDFSQKVASIQLDHADVESVKAGDDFGLKVDQAVREGDEVFLKS